MYIGIAVVGAIGSYLLLQYSARAFNLKKGFKDFLLYLNK